MRRASLKKLTQTKAKLLALGSSFSFDGVEVIEQNEEFAIFSNLDSDKKKVNQFLALAIREILQNITELRDLENQQETLGQETQAQARKTSKINNEINNLCFAIACLAIKYPKIDPENYLANISDIFPRTNKEANPFIHFDINDDEKQKILYNILALLAAEFKADIKEINEDENLDLQDQLTENSYREEDLLGLLEKNIFKNYLKFIRDLKYISLIFDANQRIEEIQKVEDYEYKNEALIFNLVKIGEAFAHLSDVSKSIIKANLPPQSFEYFSQVVWLRHQIAHFEIPSRREVVMKLLEQEVTGYLDIDLKKILASIKPIESIGAHITAVKELALAQNDLAFFEKDFPQISFEKEKETHNRLRKYVRNIARALSIMLEKIVKSENPNEQEKVENKDYTVFYDRKIADLIKDFEQMRKGHKLSDLKDLRMDQMGLKNLKTFVQLQNYFKILPKIDELESMVRDFEDFQKKNNHNLQALPQKVRDLIAFKVITPGKEKNDTEEKQEAEAEQKKKQKQEKPLIERLSLAIINKILFEIEFQSLQKEKLNGFDAYIASWRPEYERVVIFETDELSLALSNFAAVNDPKQYKIDQIVKRTFSIVDESHKKLHDMKSKLEEIQDLLAQDTYDLLKKNKSAIEALTISDIAVIKIYLKKGQDYVTLADKYSKIGFEREGKLLLADEHSKMGFEREGELLLADEHSKMGFEMGQEHLLADALALYQSSLVNLVFAGSMARSQLNFNPLMDQDPSNELFNEDFYSSLKELLDHLRDLRGNLAHFFKEQGKVRDFSHHFSANIAELRDQFEKFYKILENAEAMLSNDSQAEKKTDQRHVKKVEVKQQGAAFEEEAASTLEAASVLKAEAKERSR